MELNFPVKKPPTMTIAELTHQCNDAASKMSPNNSHRNLLLNCASAMQQLVKRLEIAEKGQVSQ